jgi:uncharacterized membrane protein YfcA
MEDILNHYIIYDSFGHLVLSWPIIIALIVAGFLVGVINTIAGSGTVITYSLFMTLGLPANIANGTIRFGVIMQTLAASFTFHQKGKLPIKKGLLLSLPVIFGTVLGAQTAASLSKDIFEKVLSIVMIAMIVFIFYDPKKWLEDQLSKTNRKLNWTQYLFFATIGFYGGFIHIGVGILLLSAIVLNLGYNLIKGNALKVFLVFMYSPFALAVFMYHHQVDYRLGLISAIGNVIGGIVASRWAIKKGANFVRWFLVVVIVLFVIKLWV